MNNERRQHLTGMLKEIGGAVNILMTQFASLPGPNQPEATQAVAFDTFAMQASAVSQGFALISERSAATAEELLNDDDD